MTLEEIASDKTKVMPLCPAKEQNTSLNQYCENCYGRGIYQIREDAYGRCKEYKLVLKIHSVADSPEYLRKEMEKIRKRAKYNEIHNELRKCNVPVPKKLWETRLYEAVMKVVGVPEKKVKYLIDRLEDGRTTNFIPIR